jgi:hypothetical protein
VCAWAYQIVIAEKYRYLFSEDKGWKNMPFPVIRSYTGIAAMEMFFAALMDDVKAMFAIVKGDRGNIEMEEVPNHKEVLVNAPFCHFCQAAMPPYVEDENGDQIINPFELEMCRVMHHDHFTGKFVGVAHSKCNFNASISRRYEVPVIFHNLKGYDGYHLVRASAECKVLGMKDAALKVVAKSMEKFTSFSLNNKVRFIDSLQFMQASLDTLVRNLDNSLRTIEDKKKSFFLLENWSRFPSAELIDADHERELEVWGKLTKKGVYPYELAKSVDELFEIKKLPTKEEFFSRLRGKHISDGEYRRAEWAWRTFGCKSLGDYTGAYCELDVLLLACVFEEFRKTTLESHRLDPTHFITLPSLSWQAMLLHNLKTGTVIETVTNDDLGFDGMMTIKRGIRGGICQVLQPYARSNVLPVEEAEAVDLSCPEKLFEQENIEDDDTGEPTSVPKTMDWSNVQDWLIETETRLSSEQLIYYIDCNNLYGTAMVEPLPVGDYRWAKRKEEAADIPSEVREAIVRNVQEQQSALFEWTVEDFADMKWKDPCMENVAKYILSIPIDNHRGYLLEVDLDYPESLHDKHNDLPFCPEAKLPPHPSDFSREQYMKYGEHSENSAFKTKKLIMDLCDKKEYVIHYRMLQLALKHGLVLKKVHSVISFRQSRWLASYINLNTDLRKQAKNSVGKDIFKLLNNAIFGKTMEDVEMRRNIEFFYSHQWAAAVKQASHPWMKAWRVIVPDELLCMEKAKHTICLDKPTIIGQAILDISKSIMYQTWYEKLKPFFDVPTDGLGIDNRISLLYCDTDSFFCCIRGLKGRSVWRDIYDLHKENDLWDLSETQYKPGSTDPKYSPPLLCYEFDGPGTSLAADRMKNAKTLGKFKDEMKGQVISEAVFLRPKMYSIKLAGELVTEHHNLKKKAKGKFELVTEIGKKKGLPKNLPNEEDRLAFQHDNYRNIYFGGPTQKVSFPTINKTKTLALYTGVATKAGLAPLDDKSYWFNAASCLRYGHYYIKSYETHLDNMRSTDLQLMDTEQLEQFAKEMEESQMILQQFEREEDQRLQLEEINNMRLLDYWVNDPVYCDRNEEFELFVPNF